MHHDDEDGSQIVQKRRTTDRLRSLRRSWPEFLSLLILGTPVLWVAGYSFLYSVGCIGLLSEGGTTEHWLAAVQSGAVISSVIYSVTIAAAVTVLVAGAAVGLVVVMPEVRHSKLLAAALCVPLATPSIVLAFLTYLTLNRGGLLSRVFAKLGIVTAPSDFPELVNDSWAIGIVIAGFFSQFPLLSLYLMKTWTSVGMDRYCRLATSLGSTIWQTRWQVAAPMLLRRGRSMILLCFLWTLGMFEIPLLLGVQHPMMYSVLIQKRSGQFNLLQRPEGFVHATIYFAILSCGLIAFTMGRRRHA